MRISSFSIVTTFFIEVRSDIINTELSNKKIEKLNKLKEKYVIHENFIIARNARKTIRFIEKNTTNFSNDYKVLKERIINTCYDILENIYRANIFQDISVKKEIVVSIQMLNFYLEEALRKDLLSEKKFLSYGNHLLGLDKMIRGWFSYETIK